MAVCIRNTFIRSNQSTIAILRTLHINNHVCVKTQSYQNTATNNLGQGDTIEKRPKEPVDQKRPVKATASILSKRGP
jgi:hypothetical protein